MIYFPEDSSSDSCSVNSLEAIEAPGYSPFTSDDNASGRKLEKPMNGLHRVVHGSYFGNNAIMQKPRECQQIIPAMLHQL